MKNVVVLMAGGKSERLWPFSRTALPKQFLSMAGDGETMIQKTVRRLLPMVSYDDIYVVTNDLYVSIVKEQLPLLPAQNILAEPAPKNTAPCIAFATAVLNEKYSDAVMLVLASDHLIQHEDIYLDTLNKASSFAANHDALLTIGISPAYPEVGYGYIHYDPNVSPAEGIYPVHRFVEKPNQELAQQYCASGEYLWNSGMFVWRLSVITRHFKEMMPSTYEGMLKIQKAWQVGNLDECLTDIYADLPAISVDYGIMERASSIFTIPGTFRWLDVGNWNAMPLISSPDEGGNLFNGDVVCQDTANTIVRSESKRLVALIGLENLAVIDTEDILLISDRNKLSDIKKVLAQLRTLGRLDKL